MTKKEKLANEYVELKKQFDGTEFKADIKEHQTWWLTREFKCEQLETKIKAVQTAIADKAKREAREAWFATEEGNAWKTEREAQLEQLRKQYVEIRNSAFQYTRTVVKNLLGEGFDVTRFSEGNMEIGLVESYREDGTANGLFGHEFTVSFGKGWDYTKDGVKYKYEWEMNYGTMGSFDMVNDSNRVIYLVGMAKFASDTVVIPALREYLHGVVKSMDALQEATYKIKEELKNPAIPQAA